MLLRRPTESNEAGESLSRNFVETFSAEVEPTVGFNETSDFRLAYSNRKDAVVTENGWLCADGGFETEKFKGTAVERRIVHRDHVIRRALESSFGGCHEESAG